ncbi:WbqC family protein [Roseomonas sp. GC11]|uniref:WbqC family protein n=1 Tax=Roseomonas sp. GC11 TaxID=2950546 RepID=UPI00210BCED1|nr:WbqC family protein [Roseomonas sp. GC11]MCQ4161684.1 WbqC family protein [Roseomonas sp. GC11]
MSTSQAGEAARPVACLAGTPERGPELPAERPAQDRPERPPEGRPAGRVVVVQSCYLPWRGYFAMLARAEACILLDSVQFTRRDWRNRNRIKTPRGLAWITVPVRSKGLYHAPIDAIELDGTDWIGQHMASLEANYARAPHARAELPWIAAQLRAAAGQGGLSAMNAALLRALLGRLGIATPLLRDTDLLPRAALDAADPTGRLIRLCQEQGARRYLSGPAARAYLDEARFAAAGIAVEWMDYGGLPEYPQPWGPFAPQLSIVDLLLNTGPAAPGLLAPLRAAA